MKVLFLTSGSPLGASPRFRVYQYLPYLSAHGVECDVSPPVRPEVQQRLAGRSGKGAQLALVFAEVATRLRDLRRAPRFDAVFVQKGITTFNFRGFDGWLFARNPRVVYDFDDAVFLRPPQQFSSRLRALQDFEQVARIITHSRLVIAGNAYLAEFAQRHNANATIIPTPIDTSVYQPKPLTLNSEPFAILWSGSTSTNQYANRLAPVLRRVAQRVSLRLLLISNDLSGIARAAFDGVPLEFRPWRLETEVADLQAGDVGVMPLPDDGWTRGKCGLKALQCMACGLPVVVSPVGVNAEIVTDGTNGFLANSENEWVDRLHRLVNDEKLRRRLGQAARKTVEERYSLHVHAPRLLRVLEEVIR